MLGHSCCSTFSPAFGAAGFLDFAILTCVYLCLIAILICIYLITYCLEHFSIHFFAICVSSLVRCLLRSFAHYFSFCFLIVKFSEFFVYFDDNSLSVISFANLFSQSAFAFSLSWQDPWQKRAPSFYCSSTPLVLCLKTHHYT